ncbi:MAG: hypothetical protein WA728_09965 [Xanthobacteraceae bacterium]
MAVDCRRELSRGNPLRSSVSHLAPPRPQTPEHRSRFCEAIPVLEGGAPRKTPSLILPSEAIIFNAKGLSVAVVEDGTADLRNVNVVRDFGATVQVNSGVMDGDQVILAPPVDLAEGQKVHVRTKPVRVRLPRALGRWPLVLERRRIAPPQRLSTTPTVAYIIRNYSRDLRLPSCNLKRALIENQFSIRPIREATIIRATVTCH